ncbi:MAG: L,D-transpeptidase, partial [Saprospiraceae bacterium]|nr:L,D-transpeptidase [Saprospiraceae bacterium]
EAEAEKLAESVPKLPDPEPPIAKIPVTKEISAGRFFQFMEKVIRQYDTLSLYPLSENLLLRANPWILDTLVNTDYYYQMSLGNFVYDLKKMRILKPGDTLLIPGPKTAATLLQKIVNTRLDINIPAFELSILEGDSLLYSIPVRVGKDQKKYLESAGRRVDLRTRTGTGEIIRVNRFPSFVNPVDGKKFKFTKRDDHQTTLMPQIPWLEPAINGQRLGQMIHPTTNPRSLGKPASNGCIGVNEANAWRIYFFAPVGTKVTIRYDLEEINAEGDTVRYEDIYRLRKTGKSAEAVPVAGIYRGQPEVICICDSIF